MPNFRTYIPIVGEIPNDDELDCSFQWLLSRSETNAHIVASGVSQLEMALTTLRNRHQHIPILANIIDTLLKKRAVTFSKDHTLTAGTFHPRCNARPNGACLLIWGDHKQANLVEAQLGPIGAIGVLPWMTPLIQPWINHWSVPAFNCADLRQEADPPEGPAS